MLDFLMIATRSTKRGVVEVYPKFVIKKSTDLMIRGGDFYAIWLEDLGLWSTEEQDALGLIDRELERYASENQGKFDVKLKVLHMWDAESGMIDSWHKYCQKQMRDCFHPLDDNLIFSNHQTTKKDYASKRLSYPLEEGDKKAYDLLMSTLYSEEERQKIEWAIGSIVCGESKKIQKFVVLYGAAGTGKSTVLNIIQQLFEGYYSVFDARALGSSSNSFALEAFKSNPLIAIQHDGDLSRIEDNTRLNSLVSHELMTVNEKFRSTYANRFKCFLFLGTNKPVKITDGRSGLIRRLIDVSPSGNKLSVKDYKQAVYQVSFELGAIAYHCQQVYLDNPGRYDDYIPVAMLGASNDFYNFVIDSYHVFKKEDGVTLKAAWEMYKTYCEDARVPFPFAQRIFKEELKNYFVDYKERFNLEDGSRVRSYYVGFRAEKFQEDMQEVEPVKQTPLNLDHKISILDTECGECLAQYATTKGTPKQKWEKVKTTLSELDTTKLHYVKLPDNHIVIDFDIPGDDGKKSRERNLEEARKWPVTYSEYSKSGAGVHLHYIYSGDPSKLSSIYDEHIEIKTSSGNSAIRRKVSSCNKLKIATISSGLPLKGEKMVNFDSIKSEKGLRTMIKRNLNKEIHPSTKPSIDFIHKILEDASASDLNYDLTDMRNAVLAFAASSSNQADYCIKLVNKMTFKSEDPSIPIDNENAEIVFYDVEVFPNLFLVNWKIQGEGKTIVRMINPSPTEIEELMKYRLVGFNCRRYDNHILYARLMGYDNEQLYKLSQRIISGGPNAYFGEAYNVSYTDVYDFSSTKQSLKKFEIELGLVHKELGLPWDQPVPEERWLEVAEYCDNDVIATEAVFEVGRADFLARQILADLAGMSVNDTTNSLTTKIIFGSNRKPQDRFNYRDMGDTSVEHIPFKITTDNVAYNKYGDEHTTFDLQGRPVFPGYRFDHGKSTYRGEEVGEGGYVYSEIGAYGDVALLDVQSMHPASIVAENLFGDEYTKRFEEIVDARVAIKHGDFETARKMLGGALAPYLTDESTAGDLSKALKIAINSVYGLTSATFDNAFRDKRNVDNIVAKRGALFMINLKHEVQQQGFTVAHIKTDSIKIPDATLEIIQFVTDYGKQYGYIFEHEATYDRMCLVNKAVYIARYASKEKCEQLYGYIPGDNKKHPDEWAATGTQFAVPYVFKTLFSKDELTFDDCCESKSVTTALYLDMNEGLVDVTKEEPESDESGHDYHFVGRVGRFCPVKDGAGGGLLYRKKDDKYYAVSGTKGHRWMESEMVKELGKEKNIDRSYYEKMVDDAKKTVHQYCEIDWFVSTEPYNKENNGIHPF